jgi:hypothetical protein
VIFGRGGSRPDNNESEMSECVHFFDTSGSLQVDTTPGHGIYLFWQTLKIGDKA